MAYDKINFYDGVSFGYMLLSKEALSDDEVLVIDSMESLPNWNSLGRDVFNILANFENTLDSSYILGVSEPLTGWSVYREESANGILSLVGKVGVDTLSVEDPLVGNSRQYKYYVFPETKNMIGVSMESDPIVFNNLWNYSLIGLKEDENEVFFATDFWNFSLNVQSNNVQQNLDITSFETLQKFNKISKGKRNYLNMSITCLLGDISDSTGLYDSNIEKLNSWREFCANSDKCIWKDRFGDIRIVSLYENPTTQYLDETCEQAQEISFSIIEIMDIDNIKNGLMVETQNSLAYQDKTFNHYQYSASKIWTINHQLKKNPDVKAYTNEGERLVGKIDYVDLDILTISYTEEACGYAFVN